MKKSLLALAVLGAFAGVASAQSSVTLTGTLDVNGRYVKNDAASRRVSESTDGINSSQLVFLGKEDLGGGLWAGFNLNAGLSPDTGAVGGGNGTAAPVRTFSRRSTVSLWGNFGEVRLGRDYNPTFWNQTIFDAFGTNGVGSSLNMVQLTTATLVRTDNSVGYFLPSGLGGLYGQVMVGASENAQTNPGRYVGGRVGFAAGPFDVAVAAAEQRLDALAGHPQEKLYNIGGSYDLSVVKLMGYFHRETLSFGAVDKKENRFSLSAVVPVGQGEIHVGYDNSKLTNSGVSTKIDQFKAGYVYNLSKRTALYSTASRLSNKNGTLAAIAGGNPFGSNGTVGSSPKSTGFEAGLRHFF
jgi:predicted porin